MLGVLRSRVNKSPSANENRGTDDRELEKAASPLPAGESLAVRKGTATMSESDIVKDFLIESYENLDRLDRDLVGLEKNPEDKEALAGVFRTIHTIKGTCGFLGFSKLERVAHIGESLLTLLRDGDLTLNPERTTALL